MSILIELMIALSSTGVDAAADSTKRDEGTPALSMSRMLRAGENTQSLERFPDIQRRSSGLSFDPRITGAVRSIGPDGAIETSFGTKGGVAIGQELDVLRDEIVIARLVIRSAQDEAAIGEIVSESLRSQARVGDRLQSAEPIDFGGRRQRLRAAAVVTKVGAKDLVEISIGADDGLKVGMELTIFRGRSYIARIVLRETKATSPLAKSFLMRKRGRYVKEIRFLRLQIVSLNNGHT